MNCVSSFRTSYTVTYITTTFKSAVCSASYKRRDAVKNHGAENPSQVNMRYNTIRSTGKAKRTYRLNNLWRV